MRSQSTVAAQDLPTCSTDKHLSSGAALVLLPKAWLLPAGLTTHLGLQSHKIICLLPRSSSGKVRMTWAYVWDSSLKVDFLTSPSQPTAAFPMASQLPCPWAGATLWFPKLSPLRVLKPQLIPLLQVRDKVWSGAAKSQCYEAAEIVQHHIPVEGLLPGVEIRPLFP